MNSMYNVDYTRLLWILVMCLPVISAQLAGTFATCKEEGSPVEVPLITDNPCFSCVCKNGRVECMQKKCPSVEGCYVILFDSFGESKKCCDVCKGCTFRGITYESNTTWTDENNPCVTYTCLASAVTVSKIKCYTPCTNPVAVIGKCCPSCDAGCFFDGKQRIDGETFKLSSDPCVECTCRGGNISCEKHACPALICRESKIHTPEGSCCPVCQGKRMIFNLPRGLCYFQTKIYRSGAVFRHDQCTLCKCDNGTSVCERENCAHLDCPEDQQFQVVNSCCKACPKKCDYNGFYYQHGQTWKPDICTTCDCNDGTTHCQVQQCNNMLWCHNGYVLKFIDGECCPRCVEARAVCTVFGDPHYRSYDGRIFNFQGTCKYLLTGDCKEKTFTIKVRNDARTSSKFTWTRMLVIYLHKVRISFLQRLRVKVKRKIVKLPYHSEGKPAFSVIKDGYSVVLKVDNGLQVTWDGDSFVEVSVPTNYRHKLCGLCGNFNGLGTDDLRGKDGKLYYNGEEFGDTWRLGGRGSCSIRPELHNTLSPCQTKPEALIKAKKECSLLISSVFYKCRTVVDVRPYYSSCVTDMCDCPDNKVCECESFKAYSNACSREGIFIRWEQHSECIDPNLCPVGAVYDRCGSACPKTCENYNSVERCHKLCVPGCQCPSGLVLHKHKCISPADCPIT
ncbi:hypothetical protein CHS0354_040579 [Potamilus streckersoni]|uniref:BMP-binding endothelial regulator protein n=1 Tax=Potamilus streckersoni TaxID=2493646 RepID=A0AAE0SGN1_9BIVA|nr:hypothetical protein CHS0354_040579 [Potamilus streckersoni]